MKNIFFLLLVCLPVFYSFSSCQTTTSTYFKQLFATQPQKTSLRPEIAKLDATERLQKVISRAGVCSRRTAEALILDGRVTVNGKMAFELGTSVRVRSDVVAVDGRKIIIPDSKKIFWIMLNKPKNVLTTTSDENKRDTVMDFVSKAKELRLLPVGRLDKHTSGLLLMTNDNGWIHYLTHPSSASTISKRFHVVIRGCPTERILNKIRQDFTIESEIGRNITMQKCLVQIIDYDRVAKLSTLELLLLEYSQDYIEKAMEYLNIEIVGIKRVSFGPIELGSLEKGKWRELSMTEIHNLKESCKVSPPLSKDNSINEKNNDYDGDNEDNEDDEDDEDDEIKKVLENPKHSKLSHQDSRNNFKIAGMVRRSLFKEKEKQEKNLSILQNPYQKNQMRRSSRKSLKTKPRITTEVSRKISKDHFHQKRRELYGSKNDERNELKKINENKIKEKNGKSLRIAREDRKPFAKYLKENRDDVKKTGSHSRKR